MQAGLHLCCSYIEACISKNGLHITTFWAHETKITCNLSALLFLLNPISTVVKHCLLFVLQECQKDLASVLPALQQAIASLETLDKASISEIK